MIVPPLIVIVPEFEVSDADDPLVKTPAIEKLVFMVTVADEAVVRF